MYIFKFNKICRNAEGGGGTGGGDSAASGDATQGNADAGADSSATNADAGATAGADQTKVNDKAATGADADKAKASDFVLPDEYKEKPWAAKIKSTEDLYKQVDNLTALVGKKNAYPAADATPEQLNEYYTGLRPESADKYDFGEGDFPSADIFKEMLFKSNVSPHQAKPLAEAFKAYQANAIAEMTSEAGFKEVMTKQFGENYQPIVDKCDNAMKLFYTEAEQKAISSLPNEYHGLFYKLNNSYLTEIANIKDQYGVKEGGDSTHSEKGGIPNGGVSVETKRSEIRKQIRELEKAPHTAQQKQALVDALQATYSNQKK